MRLDADGEANLADIRTYLEKAAEWGPIARALSESRTTNGVAYSRGVRRDARREEQGVWVYLRYVLMAIEEEHGPGAAHPRLDLDALPEGLWHYYAKFWRRYKDAHEQDWHTLLLPLLATLAAVREPLSFELLCKLAAVDNVSEFPQRWRPVCDGFQGRRPLPALPRKSRGFPSRTRGAR